MREDISSHPDFKNEKTKIAHFYSKEFAVFFLFLFHCKLNPIEHCWGQDTRFTRVHRNYTIAGLRKNVPEGLDYVTLENITNYFRKSRHYMFCYLQGVAGGPQFETLIKEMKTVYTSDWRVGVDE